MHPNYLLTSGYDISLLKLSRARPWRPRRWPARASAASGRPGTLETIVGWGATEEGGDLPDNLQEAHVPITTDSYCAGAYSDFDAQTMVCAGFPQGGVDTCQGDSGGPMFGAHVDRRAAGRRHDELRRGLRAARQAGRLRPRGGRHAAAVDRREPPRAA